MAKDTNTIGVTIRLWTDGIAGKEGYIVPGHAWAGGTIYVQANPAHGIRAGKAVPFNRWAELPLKLEEALEAAGVRLHIGTPADRLYPIPVEAAGGDGELQPLPAHYQAVWDYLAGLAASLDPDAPTHELVAGPPGYVEVRDAVDPDKEHFKGARAAGIGDALRAILPTTRRTTGPPWPRWSSTPAWPSPAPAGGISPAKRT
jgi:hypothetical protein